MLLLVLPAAEEPAVPAVPGAAAVLALVLARRPCRQQLLSPLPLPPQQQGLALGVQSNSRQGPAGGPVRAGARRRHVGHCCAEWRDSPRGVEQRRCDEEPRQHTM